MRPGHRPQVICPRAGIERDLYCLRLPASDTSLTIIGASGALGFGLALRLGRAGIEVTIGSRDAERAEETVGRLRAHLPSARFDGLANAAGGSGQRARRAERAVSQPLARRSRTSADSLRGGQILLDATVPLAAAVSGKATRMLGVWQGSAAQQAQEMAPDGVRVVSATAHGQRGHARRPRASPLDEDVLLCGDRRDDKERVGALIDRIEGLR